MQYTFNGAVISDMSSETTDNAVATLTLSEQPMRHDARVTQYWGEVCGYIRRRFGAGPPDPDDVVQTAFAKILASQELDNLENPRAYLYTTAYNTAIDMIRSQNRHNQYKSTCESTEEANIDVDELTPERVLISEENFQIALDAINVMPEFEREALILYRIHGMTLVDIAARLGKSKTSVIRYLANATRVLVEATRVFDHVE